MMIPWRIRDELLLGLVIAAFDVFLHALHVLAGCLEDQSRQIGSCLVADVAPGDVEEASEIFHEPLIRSWD
jgi:hypothetical protein